MTRFLSVLLLSWALVAGAYAQHSLSLEASLGYAAGGPTSNLLPNARDGRGAQLAIGYQMLPQLTAQVVMQGLVQPVRTSGLSVVCEQPSEFGCPYGRRIREMSTVTSLLAGVRLGQSTHTWEPFLTMRAGVARLRDGGQEIDWDLATNDPSGHETVRAASTRWMSQVQLGLGLRYALHPWAAVTGDVSLVVYGDGDQTFVPILLGMQFTPR